MNNRTINRGKEIIVNFFEKITDLLLVKEDQVKELESLGPTGLFTNIPPAKNFDLPYYTNFQISKIKGIFNYRNPLCRQAIWEIKYRGNKKLIRNFSLLLYEYILEELTDLKDFNNFEKILLLPIPATPRRQREKGFNQCVLIVRELIKIDKERQGNNFNLLENFLIKKNDTVHQARISNRKARLKNLINTFSINMSAWPKTRNNSLRLTQTNHSKSLPSLRPTDYSFIIIDDVITTGATMREAFRALGTVGISPKKIRGFALAH